MTKSHSTMQLSRRYFIRSRGKGVINTKQDGEGYVERHHKSNQLRRKNMKTRDLRSFFGGSVFVVHSYSLFT